MPSFLSHPPGQGFAAFGSAESFVLRDLGLGKSVAVGGGEVGIPLVDDAGAELGAHALCEAVGIRVGPPEGRSAGAEPTRYCLGAGKTNPVSLH